MSIGTMLFNPFTGKPRDPRDIASDPRGTLVWDGEEPLRAAHSTPKQGEVERTVAITEKQLAAEIERGFMAGAKHAMEAIAPQALLALESKIAAPSVEPAPADPSAKTDRETLAHALRDNLPLSTQQRSVLYELVSAPHQEPGWVMHIAGPDDLHYFLNEFDALRAANTINQMYLADRLKNPDNEVLCVATVAPKEPKP